MFENIGEDDRIEILTADRVRQILSIEIDGVNALAELPGTVERSKIGVETDDRRPSTS